MDDPRSYSVLVVDDNADNRALAKATLEDEGFSVVVASNGPDGVAAFTRDRPACVLLDVRMPGMDGFTACQRIREAPGGADAPIVFVTAQRDVETFDRARLAGGDDFITKPFRPTELVLRVKTAINLHRIAAERNDLFDLLRRQRDDMMRLQLQREQLIAFLVHDLKNPVHTIRLHGELIARDVHASDRTRSAAAKIQLDSEALLRMIMNLLDLSKADEGHLIPARRTVEFGALLAEVKAAMAARAMAAGVELVIEAAAGTLDGDPDLVRRVLENLIDNAIRHAPEGTSVRVTTVETRAGLELRVADAGAGVPEELRERVFDRFVQGEAASHSGRGLGLAFCKLAVDAHGGKIWIEDGRPGAVFCVRFDGPR
jgi:two-component system, sensor histidine kinase and response regulator